ncbi:MAG: YceI family protein [Lewinellaceae bacterium]|nr:YceI family protein [Lewinellaceae bacterium]
MFRLLNPAFSRRLLWVLLFPLLVGFSTTNRQRITVKILAGSQLYLDGSSNVNKFSCYCTESLPTMQLDMIATPDGANFSDSKLRIATRSLDCKNKGINKDMYATLKADEFPHIGVEMTRVHIPGNTPLHEANDWIAINADVYLTIAGQRRKVVLNAKGKQMEPNIFRFVSAKTIQMTDFGIEPPTALLGLVKVRNEITIHFDFVVSPNGVM